MEEPLLESFEHRLEDLGATSERVEPSELTDAVVEEATQPAIASRSLAKDAWLSDTWVTVDPTPADIWDAKTGISHASFGIAPYGSIYLEYDREGSEFVSLFVNKHIAVLDGRNIFPDMDAAFDHISEAVPTHRGSGIIATGPSATADMGELVRGAHGPADVHVIIVKEGR